MRERMPRAASITTDIFNYSFRPSMDAKLALFRRYGFRFVHWCDDWNNERIYSAADISRLHKKLDKAGLGCIDVHGTATQRARIDAADRAAHRLYIRLLQNRVEFCSAVGGDAVVFHPPEQNPRTDWVGRDRLRRTARALEAVRGLCEKTGVRLAVENTGHRSHYGTRIIEWFLERYPADFVGWCYDSGHAHLAGNAKRLYGHGDRLAALHLHDNHGDWDEHQPPFNGTVDWKSVMGFIRASGYPKPVNFEITCRTRLFSGTMIQYMHLTRKGIAGAMGLLGCGR